MANITGDTPAPSQTSSHAPLEPISGTTLLSTALARREGLAQRGCLATGCAELDGAVLVGGGFERGCVVGVSAEEDQDDVALVLGLQTVARALLLGGTGSRAVVVTPMGVGALVGVLSGVVRGLLAGGAAEEEEAREREREVLQRVHVSRVFDVFGLWEVLGELDGVGEGAEGLGTPEMGQREESEEGDGAGRGENVAFTVGEHFEREEDLYTSRDVTPARRHDSSSEHEQHAPSCTDTQPAHQSEEPGTQTSRFQEPLSSPLSDPPSSLPDTPPWEAAEGPVHNVEEEGLDMMELPRRTPPGRRDEIQDSEEGEGFSSPLLPAVGGSLGTDAVVVPRGFPEEQDISLTQPTPPAVDLDANHSSSPPAGQYHEQDQLSPATPHINDTLELEPDNILSQTASTCKQDDQEDTSPPEEPPTEAFEPERAKEFPAKSPATEQQSRHPDIILITHMSTLLSSLFHQRDKATAHQTLQLLASHLRYLTRSPEHGGPLVMILNSTTSADFHTVGPQHDHNQDGPPRPPPAGPRTPNKPLDPTLRSIFNPPPLPVSGLSYSYDTPHSRRNKPSFGLIFTQMLDMHLLCTKIPKTREDAEALYAPGSGNKVDYVWAVEVLLDDVGVWEGREKVLQGKPRRSREQRWGAVVVRRLGGRVRVVDAFEKMAPKAPQEIVLAAGFGGRRV